MGEALLGARFRERVKGNKDIREKSEAEAGVRYPTGFLNFDFMNGSVIHVMNLKTQEEVTSYNSVGILDGSYCLFVGRSGSGKTSICLQMGGNIIKPFEHATIFHDDVEGGIEDTRKFQLMGITPLEAEEGRYIQRNAGVTTENVYSRVKEIYDEKIEHRDDYLYDTGLLDMTNHKIYKLEPTVYIVDSLAMLTPENQVDEDELSGSMAATASAKVNTRMFKRIIPMLKTANIIFFVINHITDEVSLMPKKPSLAFLKVGEALPGGKTAVYTATNIFRIDDCEKLKPTEGYKIHGTIVEVSFVKARSTFNGRSTKLVHNYETGFDAELSLLQMLRDEKVLTGSAAFPSLAGRDDMKFTLSTFKDKLHSNPEMQKVFAQECYKVLSRYITDKKLDLTLTEVSNSINNMIFAMKPSMVA